MKKAFTILLLFLGIWSKAQILISEAYFLKSYERTTQEFFIEFYNFSELNVDLNGYKILSYNAGSKLLDSTVIKANTKNSSILYRSGYNYVKINRSTKNPNFLYINLDVDNTTSIKLLSPKDSILDVVLVNNMTNGKSYCRYPINSNIWGISYTSKKLRNKPHLYGSQIYNYIKTTDSKTSVKIIESTLKDKIKINEVYLINTQDILNKDLWIELINISNENLEIQNLSILTDSICDKQSLFPEYIKSKTKLMLEPKKTTLIYFSPKQDGKYSSFSIDLKCKTTNLALYDSILEIDAVSVPELDRDESYARLPNGLGDFLKVRYKTPNVNNNQVMPGVYARPSYLFLHSLGPSISDYNSVYSKIETKPRLGSIFSVSFQHSFSYLDFRHSMNIKKQGFTIDTDTTLYTGVGKLSSTTKGHQTMSYFGLASELGLSLSTRFKIFYGLEFDIRLNEDADLVTTQTASLNTGEVLSTNVTQTNEYALKLENIDLNLSCALEYNLSKKVFLNASFRKDFGGLNIYSSIPVNKSGAVSINVFQLKLVLALYQSTKLKHKQYLFKVD